MLSSLTRTYSWPTVFQDVINFSKLCESCQQTNILTQSHPGELVPLPIPDRPWSVIAIDLIVKLPLSSNNYSIFVLTNHLTKGAHVIPCNKALDCQALARLFVKVFF